MRRVYLESESEVTYEPPTLLFFSDLITACEFVAKRIDGDLEKLTSKKPQIPQEFSETAAGKWYLSLGGSASVENAAKHAEFSEADAQTIADLEKRLAEKAPAERAKELLAKKKHVDDMIQGIQSHLSKLSDVNCQLILELKTDRLVKREAAQAAATRVFSGAPLKGIGTPVWRQLWEYARQYSEGKAYPGQSFPYVATDASCVLCHQPLGGDARERLVAFEEFVRDRRRRMRRQPRSSSMMRSSQSVTCQQIGSSRPSTTRRD